MLLLDTCTLLWLVSGHGRLGAVPRERIGSAAGRVHVSAISAFEIGVKCRKGALDLPLEPSTWYSRALANHGLIEVPVTGAIALASAALPRIHDDPCDRIIVATARSLSLTILTPDPMIAAYPDARAVWDH